MFDVLWLNGADVTALPLDERRALLRDHPVPAAAASACSRWTGRAPWERACAEGWEGVIAKRLDSLYEHRRSPHWLKMKCEATQELVVGGFTDPQGSRVGLGALLVGYFEGEDFVFAGKVGTGFDTALLLELRARLDRSHARRRRSRRAPACRALRVHWVRAGGGRAGGVHRVDGARQAASSAAARRPHRQGRAREVDEGAAVTAPAITHPEKVLFPDDGITKGELAAYYDAVAPVMLPHIRRRPITMERFPNGIGEKGFIQKDVSKGFPEWLKRVEVPKKGGTVHYPLANDRRSLQWLANQNCDHASCLAVARAAPRSARRLRPRPRSVARRARGAARGDAGAARGARRAGPCQLGEDVGVEGLSHRGAARRRRATFERCRRRLADRVAGILVERHPSTLTQEFTKADRGGRIFIDTGRNRPGATFAAAYTVRPKPGAPVSAPCTWEEVENGTVRPQTFTLRTMADRIAAVGDLWQRSAGEEGRRFAPVGSRASALRASVGSAASRRL